MKFCMKLSKSATETFDMICRVYGNEAMGRVKCFEWHTAFRNDRTSLDDDNVWAQT